MTKPTFEVTEYANLTVDGRRILPGSTLILSAPAPAHWKRFGKPGFSGDEPQMVVATPSATDATATATDATAPKMPGMPGVDDLDKLHADYTEFATMLGKEDVTADKRWGVQRLQKEVDALKAEVEG